MIGSMAQSVLGVTDTAFLSRVGEIELGASAIGGVFYFVLVMIGMGIGIGAQIMMARKAGENDHASIGRIFDHSIILLILLALIIFFIVYFFRETLFGFIIQSPEILASAGIFLKFRIWGILFVMIAAAFRAFYIGISQTRIITYSAILMASLNILLNYLLIFGNFGFPEMGIAGAGLASAISECVAAFYLLVYTFFKRDFQKFRLFSFHNMERDLYERIINISTPIVTQHLISMGAWFAFFVFIERLGEHQLAISNVIRSNYMILMTPMWGYASAANSMVSNLIGQNKAGEVMGLLKKIIKLSCGTAVVLVFVNVIFARQMLHLTASTEILVNDGLLSYYIICLATLVFSVSMVMFSGVSGTGATRAAMFLEISNIIIYLGYVYICSYILKTPVEVVWFSEVLYWGMMGTFSYYYLKSRRWEIIRI